jgi:hypothetical protein
MQQSMEHTHSSDIPKHVHTLVSQSQTKICTHTFLQKTNTHVLPKHTPPTRTHTYNHTYTHPHLHPLARTHTHTYTYKYPHPHLHPLASTHAHAQDIRTRPHTYIHSHARTHMHRMYAPGPHLHPLAHTHAHAQDIRTRPIPSRMDSPNLLNLLSMRSPKFLLEERPEGELTKPCRHV